MNRRIPAVALACAVALPVVLAGCGGASGGTTTTERRATEESPGGTTTTAAPSPWAPGALAPILADLETQLGHPPRYLAMRVFAESVDVEVQQPRVRRYVDTYRWRDGRWDGPDPQRVNYPADELDTQVFGPSDLNLDAIPRLVARGDRMPIEGSRTSAVVIRRYGTSHDVEILVVVSGTREDGRIQADSTGRVRRIY